jgi:hypothetical protein
MVDLQQPDPVNIRSSNYYIARTDTQCWHCGRWTPVLALAVPEGHLALDTEAEELNAWQSVGVSAFLFYVVDLPDGVQRRVAQLCPEFRVAHGDAAQISYWANHCEHCDSLLGDHELHCEPDGGFMPCSEPEAARIWLLRIGDAFEAAAAGYAPEPEFFRFMRKV